MIGNEIQPEYVIPFQITKEKALENLRQRMDQGFYVSKDFLEYEIKMIPAYVPFWLMDVFYEDHQVWRYKEASNEASKYAQAGGRIHLDRFSVDGIHDLEDVITCGLGPYDYAKMVPNSQIMPVEDVLKEESVTVECEIGKEEAEDVAAKMIQAAFNREIKNRVNVYKSKILRSEPRYEITNSTLVLLPIWFCVIYGNDGEYVAYVNGQTGKEVYTLPASPKKTALSFAGFLAAIVGSLFATMDLLYWNTAVKAGIDERTILFILGVIYLPITALLIYVAKEIWHEGVDASIKHKIHLNKVNAGQNLSFLKIDL